MTKQQNRKADKAVRVSRATLFLINQIVSVEQVRRFKTLSQEEIILDALRRGWPEEVKQFELLLKESGHENNDVMDGDGGDG